MDSIDSESVAGAGAGRWAFAALLGGNVALSLGAMLVRMAEADGVGPTASAFWRMTLPRMIFVTRPRRSRTGC